MKNMGVFLLVLNLICRYESREIPGAELDCWRAVYKMRSCSNEIAAYFSNGSIDIDQPCCEAIALLTHHCWPAILGVLSYGLHRTHVLRGYCDASASTPSPVGQPMTQLLATHAHAHACMQSKCCMFHALPRLVLWM